MTTPVPQEHQFKEFEHFSMFAASPGLENIRARLAWSSFRGNPRITVFTGHKDEKQKSVVLHAPMDPDTFGVLMIYLEEMCRAEPGTFKYINNFTREKMEEGSDKLGAVIPKSDTYVGKDKEGYMWISVRVPNSPECVFRFTPSMFHKFRKGNNEEVSPAELSVYLARSRAANLREAFGPHMAILKPPYDPNAPKPQRGKFPNKGQTAKKDYADLDDIMF